ncbi:RNA-directed DNA polymerase from mobile element jockey-like protein [Willisornis vidua]|uniref:RNA-directed DNA polymerase from mobile element jockey-like protein n=1 Tax=Willisornis vidua TaxID=1566151 RepID=A0ABQ9CZZ1_9PASS|nr:RNA-directed DNA polymerase from mobile element jockey-like protein [Willisornis vidua]
MQRRKGNQPPELVDRVSEQNGNLEIWKEAVSDMPSHLDAHKSVGLDAFHPAGRRELAGDFTKLLSIIYSQSWLTREVSDDWRLASVMPVYEKGLKEEWGNYKTVRLTLVPGKVMKQIILSAIMQHIQDHQWISQYRFRKGRPCLTNLISFYDRLIHLVDEGEAVYLDFRKAFDNVSHNILLENLTAYGLDGCTICWVKNWLNGLAQKVVVNITGATSSWQLVTSGVPQGSVTWCCLI